MQKFKLWLEFEEVDLGDDWDPKNEFCNIQVSLTDGRRYGITVWSYQFFQTSISNDKTSGKSLNGMYQVPPGLLVEELTRDCIEKVIKDLVDKGDLEKAEERRHQN